MRKLSIALLAGALCWNTVLASEAPTTPWLSNAFSLDTYLEQSESGTAIPRYVWFILGVLVLGAAAAAGGGGADGGGAGGGASGGGDDPIPDSVDPMPDPARDETSAASPGTERSSTLSLLAPRNGFFLSGGFLTTDRSATERSIAGETRQRQVNIGYDRRFGERVILGAVADVSQLETTLSEGTSQTSGTRLSAIAFAHHQIRDNLGLSAYIGTGSLDNDIERDVNVSINDTLGVLPSSATSEGTETLVGLSAQLDVLTQRLANSPWTFTVKAALDASELTVGAYDERVSGTLVRRFGEDSRDSLRVTAGLIASRAFSLESGVGVLQASFEPSHEFRNDAREQSVLTFQPGANTIESTFRTDRPDRQSSRATLSAIWVGRAGKQAFINYSQLVGHDYLSDTQLTLGARWDF